jgi:hypothetical protein
MFRPAELSHRVGTDVDAAGVSLVAVPPNRDVERLYAMANPAYRTWEGNIAEMVLSCGT